MHRVARRARTAPIGVLREQMGWFALALTGEQPAAGLRWLWSEAAAVVDKRLRVGIGRTLEEPRIVFLASRSGCAGALRVLIGQPLKRCTGGRFRGEHFRAVLA